MNVVFDVGNVLVRWLPVEIMRRATGGAADSEVRAQEFFGHELWRRLNRGHFTWPEAREHFAAALGLEPAFIDRVFRQVLETQDPVPGSHELLRRLHAAGVPLYALTDNVHEIVAHLKQRYDFWGLLQGAAQCERDLRGLGITF